MVTTPAYSGILQFCSIMLLCLIWNSNAIASTGEARLTISANKTSIELGQPVVLQLHSNGLASNLSKISLKPLNQDFGVEVLEYARETKTGKEIQTLTVKLYPRHIGTLNIPSLILDGYKTSSIPVNVIENSFVKVHSHITNTSPWMRQQTLITMDFSSKSPFFKLETDQGDENETIPFPVEKYTSTENGVSYSVQKIGWFLFPLQDGSMHIALPPVRYVRNGAVKGLFYFPQVLLNVRPLPSYIPPTMPVGKISIQSTLTPDSWLHTGRLGYWNVKVHGEHVPSEWLPSISRQIKSSDNIQFLPVDSKRYNSPDSNGVRGEASYNIPFEPLSNGLLTFPSLRVQYFDPDTGRIGTIYHQIPSIFSLSLFWRITLISTSISAVVTLFLFIVHSLRIKLQRKKLRTHAMRLISQANEWNELRDALDRLAKAEGWPGNLTLSAWLKHWQSHYSAPDQLLDLFQQLSSHCYSGNHSNEIFLTLKKSLHDHLAKPRNVNRGFNFAKSARKEC